MKFDGERVVINDTTPSSLIQEHLGRYLFAKPFVKNKTVLDIACGTGYGSFELAKSGAKKVIGGDISKKAIDYASQKYKRDNLLFRKLNGQSIDLSESSVDVVISFETIEHIPNYRKFLSEVGRVLKGDGLFICSSPNKKITSPYTKKPLNSYHIKEFKINELSRILDREGFENIETFGQSFVNNNWKFKLKNLVRSYAGFTRGIYRKFLKSGGSSESKGYLNKILKLRDGKLDPTYFILIANKK